MPDSKLINEVIEYYVSCDYDMIKTFDKYKDLPIEDRRFIFDFLNKNYSNNLKDFTQYKEFVDVFLSDNYNSFQMLKYFLDNNIKISDKLKENLIAFVVNSDIFKDKIYNAINNNYDLFLGSVNDNNKVILESLKSGLFDYNNLSFKQKYNLFINMFFDEKDLSFEKYSNNIYYSIDDLVNSTLDEDDDLSFKLLNEKFSNLDFNKEKEDDYEASLNLISNRIFNYLNDNNLNLIDFAEKIADEDNKLSLIDIKELLSKKSSAIDLLNGFNSYIHYNNISNDVKVLYNDLDLFIVNYNDELENNDKTRTGVLYDGSNGLRINDDDIYNLINTDYGLRYVSAEELDLNKCNIQAVLAEFNNVMYYSFGLYGLNKMLNNGTYKFETKKEAFLYLYNKITDFGTIINDIDYFNNISNLLKNIPTTSEVIVFNRFINDLKDKILNKENDKENDFSEKYKNIKEIKDSFKNFGKNSQKINTEPIKKERTTDGA